MHFYWFASIFFTLYGALNYYIGRRGWQWLNNSPYRINGKAYWIIFGIIVISSIIGTLGSKVLPDVLKSVFALIGSYWLAAMTYFLLILALIDIIRVLDKWTAILPGIIRNNPAFNTALGLCVIVFVAALLVYGTWNARNIKTTSYNISIPKQAGSIKKLHIVMLSDLHLSNINDHRQNRIIAAVNRLNPDIVLIPGDISDDLATFINRGYDQELQKIKSRYGVYASPGNHDYLSGDIQDVEYRYSEAGLIVLKDNSRKIAGCFYVIGRSDKSSAGGNGKKRRELSALTEGMDRKLPLILLDHEPVDLEEAEKAGIDLQLSGHTHKGQFFPFNLITQRVFKTDYGYLKTGGLQLIVTSGAAPWGPPVRIGSISEVVDITVNFTQQ